jgi:hypothetical protein
MSGVAGILKHSVLAKRSLDQDRTTPGAHQPEGGHLMSLASTGNALEYLATNNIPQFHAAINDIQLRLAEAYQEIINSRFGIRSLMGLTAPTGAWAHESCSL